MSIIKTIGRALGVLALLLLALVGLVLGLALCLTLIGLVPGVLVIFGSVGCVAAATSLAGADATTADLRAMQDRMRARLAPRQKV